MRRVARFLSLCVVAGCSTGTHGRACGPSAHDTGCAAPDGGSRTDGAAEDAGPVVVDVPLPDGPPGIGFDDLRWAPRIGKILAPAGRTGRLDLVDPVTLAVDSIDGFSASTTFAPGGHANGCTSADEGTASLFAIDHETTTVRLVDPVARTTGASAVALADPDYVRYVASTGEIWVTEPLTGIEIFSVGSSGAPAHLATIAVTGGPEAIVVDAKRGRVYTNSFIGQTFAVDVSTRTVVETWQNGCALSLGLALDVERGFLFVACQVGKVVVLDVANGGQKLGELTQGSGLDILSYDPALHHLYVQGSASGDLAILGVSAGGVPSLLGTVSTAASSTSVTDERGHVFVGDPDQGGLLRVRDTFAATP